MKKLFTILMLTMSMSLMASGSKIVEPMATESIVEPVYMEPLAKIHLNTEKLTFDDKRLVAGVIGFQCYGNQHACRMAYLALLGNPTGPLPAGCHKTSDNNSNIYYCQIK